MKKTLLLTLLVAGATSAFSQGFLDWGNNFTGTFRAPIYNADPANPNGSTSGQSSLGVPAGSTAYAGPLLQGTGYTFQIFAGPSSVTDPNNLTLLATTTFRTAAGNALPAGLVFGATTTVPGVNPGSTANFVIRAFDNQGGTITTWAQALAAGVARGNSAITTTGPLGGIDPVTGNIVANPSTTGWSSFNIAAVPEPTSFALAGLGAAALLIFRRRK